MNMGKLVTFIVEEVETDYNSRKHADSGHGKPFFVKQRGNKTEINNKC